MRMIFDVFVGIEGPCVRFHTDEESGEALVTVPLRYFCSTHNEAARQLRALAEIPAKDIVKALVADVYQGCLDAHSVEDGAVVFVYMYHEVMICLGRS